jgi:RNA polymerase sigma factor (sigma-70 family)
MDRDEFVRRYAEVVRAYLGARWRESPLQDDIDDAAQDVFLECFRENGALARVDPAHRGGFRTFLFAVVRNVARRFEERRNRRREQRVPTGLDLPAGDSRADQAFEHAWAQSIMRLATRRLEERSLTGGDVARRRVELLRMRFTDGHPTRWIAEQWGLKPAQVQYEYKCAREEFRAALIDVVREHDPDGDVEEECGRLLSLFE